MRPGALCKIPLAVSAVSEGIQYYCCPTDCMFRLKVALRHKLALTELLQEMDSVLM